MLEKNNNTLSLKYSSPKNNNRNSHNKYLIVGQNYIVNI